MTTRLHHGRPIVSQIRTIESVMQFLVRAPHPTAHSHFLSKPQDRVLWRYFSSTDYTATHNAGGINDAVIARCYVSDSQLNVSVVDVKLSDHCHSLLCRLASTAQYLTISSNVCFPDSGCRPCDVESGLRRCYIHWSPCLIGWAALLTCPPWVDTLDNFQPSVSSCHSWGMIIWFCWPIAMERSSRCHYVCITKLPSDRQTVYHTASRLVKYDINGQAFVITIYCGRPLDQIIATIRTSGSGPLHERRLWRLVSRQTAHWHSTDKRRSPFCEHIHMHECCTCTDQYTSASAGFMPLSGPTRATRQHDTYQRQ